MDEEVEALALKGKLTSADLSDLGPLTDDGSWARVKIKAAATIEKKRKIKEDAEEKEKAKHAKVVDARSNAPALIEKMKERPKGKWGMTLPEPQTILLAYS